MSQMETLPSDLGHKIQSKLQRKLSRQGSLKGKNIKPKDPKDKTPLKSDLNLKFANEIENLGGTKHDLDMFKNLGDSGSDSELEIDSNGKNIDHGEVTDFMKSLGFKVEEQKNRQEKSVQKNNTKMEKSRGRQEKSSESHEADESMEVSAANGSRGSQKTAKRSKKAERQLQKEAEEQPSHIKRKPNTDVKSQSPKRQIQLGDVKDTLTPTLEPNTLWYSYDLDEPEDVITPLTDRDIETIHTHANNLLNVCNEQFEHDNTRSSSEKQFMSQLLTAGTLNDKVSALTLLIQESPLHSMKYFNMLHSQIKKKSKGSAMQAISAIKDLLIGGVLPNRKLKWFNKQPLQEDVDPKLLVLWAFEHWLKKYYFSFLETLEVSELYFLQ